MKFIAIIATLLLSIPSFADLYLEPYLGYETGDYKSAAATYEMKGTDLGLKLGYSTLGLALGVDYMMGDLTVDSNPSVDVDAKDLGVFAQYTLPILLKVSGTYFFKSEGKTSASKMTGKGTKIGVGFTGLPFIAINLDMIRINYDEVEAGGITASTDTDRQTWMLSVSLPLNL